MNRRNTTVILSLIVALMPMLGLPIAWKDWSVTILGLLIVVVAYLPKRVASAEMNKSDTETPKGPKYQESYDARPQPVSISSKRSDHARPVDTEESDEDDSEEIDGEDDDSEEDKGGGTRDRSEDEDREMSS